MSVSKTKAVILGAFILGLLSGPVMAATEIKCKIKGVGVRNYKLEGFFNKKVFCQVAKFRHRNMLIWGDTVVNFKEPGWKMRYRYAKIGQDYVDSQPNGREIGTCRFWESK